MNYSVVVVTYNRKELLRECLENLYNQTLPFAEIIVINNGSIDGTEEFLNQQKLQHRNLFVYHMKKNLGGAGGFSFALSKLNVKSDYVLIIDDDAIINIDFLECIQSKMVPEVLAYSGTIKTNGKIDTSHRRRITNSILLLKEDVDVKEYQKESFDYDLSTFCGLMVCTDIIKKIGLPRRDYFIWYDDTEYSIRIRKHTKIRNINSAKINHKANSSYVTELNWKSFYGYRNALDMGKRHSTIPFLYQWYRITYHIYRVIEYKVKYLCAKNAERKKYYEFCYNLHIDVIHATKKKQLGMDTKYMPK